ncbi:hypothetical protein K469DRAFT_368132 [Zopfia rhizophila CBS 207.26]|uniref:Secreted protein n=1 Tax=Zopfia rhizophila CBS 207.26 TaxID=1314779 RepID=A0A6A6EJI9_9PEZI|nr:hypothetical protein K469DRAFT_368132 [Zopfia rhizophila CBS 207.26]
MMMIMIMMMMVALRCILGSAYTAGICAQSSCMAKYTPPCVTPWQTGFGCGRVERQKDFRQHFPVIAHLGTNSAWPNLFLRREVAQLAEHLSSPSIPSSSFRRRAQMGMPARRGTCLKVARITPPGIFSTEHH